MLFRSPEAAELAPKAALWTDAEVAEIEAFRARDWSGTNINPFDHLPAALERTIYPGPGGRRAYLKRAGDPLPEPTEAAKDRQLKLIYNSYARRGVFPPLNKIYRLCGLPAAHPPLLRTVWTRLLAKL